MTTQILKDENGNVLAELPGMSGKKDVFISYKRENAPFVVRLYHELENHEVKAWLDLDRLPNETGSLYKEKIHTGIDNSEFFLLIYTKEVENSDFIINEELKYAISKGKTILFYPYEALVPNSKLEPYVKDLQWLDTESTATLQPDTQESMYDERKRLQLAAMTNNQHGFTIYDDQNLFLIRIALQRKLGLITKYGNYEKICGVPLNEFYTNKTLQLTIDNIGLFLTPPQKFQDRLHRLKFYERGNKEQKAVVQKHIADRNIDQTKLIGRLVSFLEENKAVYSMSAIARWFESHLNASIFNDINIPCVKDMTVERFIEIVTEMTACKIISDIESGITMFNGTELGVYDIIDTRVPDVENPDVEVVLYYSDYFTFKCMTEMYHILCSISGIPFGDVNRGNIRRFAPFLCSLGLGGFLVVNNKGRFQLLWTKRGKGISSGDTWHFSYDETVSLLKDSPGGDDKIVVADDGKVHLSSNEILYRALKEELGVERAKIQEDHNGIFEIGIIKSERLEIELISSATIHLSDSKRSIESQIKDMHDTSTDGYLEISKIKLYPLHGTAHLVGKLINPEALEAARRMTTRLWENTGKRTKIGENTIIEEGSFIDDGAEIGKGCKLHRNVYVGKGVKIGNHVKIQNNNSIYPGVTLYDGVFVGTNVSFINDKYPRSIRKSDGRPVDASDWIIEETIVKEGASIGAGAVILCGVTIGEWAMVGCGAVVVTDVPPFATVVGNPARIISSKEILK